MPKRIFIRDGGLTASKPTPTGYTVIGTDGGIPKKQIISTISEIGGYTLSDVNLQDYRINFIEGDLTVGSGIKVCWPGLGAAPPMPTGYLMIRNLPIFEIMTVEQANWKTATNQITSVIDEPTISFDGTYLIIDGIFSTYEAVDAGLYDIRVRHSLTIEDIGVLTIKQIDYSGLVWTMGQFTVDEVIGATFSGKRYKFHDVIIKDFKGIYFSEIDVNAFANIDNSDVTNRRFDIGPLFPLSFNDLNLNSMRLATVLMPYVLSYAKGWDYYDSIIPISYSPTMSIGWNYSGAYMIKR